MSGTLPSELGNLGGLVDFFLYSNVSAMFDRVHEPLGLVCCCYFLTVIFATVL